MKIKGSIYRELVENSKAVPPETGGILGKRNGADIIDYYYRDSSALKYAGYYQPNTESLNQVLKKWDSIGVEIAGMFHTHHPNWPELSGGDKIYIEAIVNILLEEGECLYFPLVFPQDKMISFRAKMSNGNVYIESDELEICD